MPTDSGLWLVQLQTPQNPGHMRIFEIKQRPQRRRFHGLWAVNPPAEVRSHMAQQASKLAAIIGQELYAGGYCIREP